MAAWCMILHVYVLQLIQPMVQYKQNSARFSESDFHLEVFEGPTGLFNLKINDNKWPFKHTGGEKQQIFIIYNKSKSPIIFDKLFVRSTRSQGFFVFF